MIGWIRSRRLLDIPDAFASIRDRRDIKVVIRPN